ncbi:hypothetical protein U9M48_042412 [Paspalum notatum var. saurae]|uniref:Heat shock 70 kDa protein 14 n=1 Tax=Paspalum notatum var. saurae TaxID=547442 RepID=A0AAQ3UQS4_PASNO
MLAKALVETTRSLRQTREAQVPVPPLPPSFRALQHVSGRPLRSCSFESKMSVVGFDLGNESCIVAVARPRGIDVVLNDESKPETPAIVCFGEKQRFIGTAGAVAASTMNPKNSISQIKRLLGRKFSDPELQSDLASFPFRVTEGPDGFPLVHVRFLGEERAFTPTQLLAMRRAVLDAATIAGLRPLRLFHETTATALAYGINKTDLPDHDQLNVAFVDVGHASMQVSIVGYKKGQLKMLSHAYDRSLGGRDFDEALFKHFAAKFKEEYEIDWACEELKKVLSAKLEAPLNIECLMDEKDNVRGFIKRDEFEQICALVLERPLEKALAEAGLTTEDVHFVEVVGSGSRVPAIIEIITKFFGKQPRSTMNASECVARGCAVQCAMLSPTFKVREFNDSAPQQTIVFPKGNTVPSTKALTFYRSIAFEVDVLYVDTGDTQIPHQISTYTVSILLHIGPFQLSNGEKAKLKVKVRLNIHGIVTVDSAIVSTSLGIVKPPSP